MRRPFSNESKPAQGWVNWWLSHKEIPPRWTLAWGAEMVYICTVFAATGTSTMMIVRPYVGEVLQLKGSMKDGPWTYRFASIFIMFPVYPALLLTFGTIAGRHVYFRHFAGKMLKRFVGEVDPKFARLYRGKEFRKW